MLQEIAPNIWHVQHHFFALGLRVSSRMTVVRLQDGSLWLHSPVPLSAEVCEQLSALGEVRYVVAPSKTHHIFMGECCAQFPEATMFGAPGLHRKRPDLRNMRELGSTVEPEWEQDLDQLFFDGIPLGNESVWLHKQSGTLILTDLCQWWQGELPYTARLFASLTGVRASLAVPRTIKFMIKDLPAARASARRILAWPFTRVVVAHNAIIEEEAHRSVENAFRFLLRE